jgi:hypothetical protein
MANRRIISVVRYWLFAIGVLLCRLPALGGDTKSKVSNSPMDRDQVAVYHAFLATYSNGTKSDHLNLAERTSRLELSDAGNACLRGISIELGPAESILHQFDPKVPLRANITLVDPDEQGRKVRANDPHNTMRQGKSVDRAVEGAFASGLLTLSEVAFDKKHEYAVMRFSFWCGGLCGHGGMIVYQKRNGKWERTDRHCGGWIS